MTSIQIEVPATPRYRVIGGGVSCLKPQPALDEAADSFRKHGPVILRLRPALDALAQFRRPPNPDERIASSTSSPTSMAKSSSNTEIGFLPTTRRRSRREYSSSKSGRSPRPHSLPRTTSSSSLSARDRDLVGVAASQREQSSEFWQFLHEGTNQES